MKNKTCQFCKSQNIGKFYNPLFIKDNDICFYCYTVLNNNQIKNIRNKSSEDFINEINITANNIIKKYNYNNIFIFNKLTSINGEDKTDTGFNLIEDYESSNLNQFLKNGIFDFLIVPDANAINLDNFLKKINDYINFNSRILIGFYREKHYCNDLYNYNYIYNCYSIDRIAKKYNLYVQPEFVYKDGFYLIQLFGRDPENFEIENLEKLTNTHITEDYQRIFNNFI